MRAFRCDHCGQLVFFENSLCLRCESPLGFTPSDLELHALVGDRAHDRHCANLSVAGCNWIVEDDEPDGLCISCRKTSVRPADDDESGLDQYAEAERAKRRVFYQLMDLGLPVDADELDFQLKSSETEPVTTGHADGVVTLDLAESDDAQRVARQEQLGEPYRTLVGHFRHELGHYYQDILLNTDQKWSACRAMFGDDRASYQDALDRHYENGPPSDWPDRFVSAYATMHAWEDWAETFAHYLHIRDTLQTAADFGVSVDGPAAVIEENGATGEFESIPQDSAVDTSFDEIMADWLPLTYALNQINRSMGRNDLYPFSLSQPAIDKLTFMHLLMRALRNENEILASMPAGAAGPDRDPGPADAEPVTGAKSQAQSQG